MAGEKRYKCTYDGCQKAFAKSCDLTRHERTHTGEKPFKCTFEGCQQPFTQKQTLKRHQKTHSKQIKLIKKRTETAAALIAKAMVEPKPDFSFDLQLSNGQKGQVNGQVNIEPEQGIQAATEMQVDNNAQDAAGSLIALSGNRII